MRAALRLFVVVLSFVAGAIAACAGGTVWIVKTAGKAGEG